MRRKSGLIAGLAALALLTLAATFTPVRAEVYTAVVNISPLNESPPITNSTATGGFLVTVDVTRDTNGTITSAKINYLGALQGFPAGMGSIITGLHIHEGTTAVNGPVRFGTRFSGSVTQTLNNGAGVVNEDVTGTIDLAILARMLANPAGFYLNIHTQLSPGGAARAQLTRLTETIATTVTLNTAQEVPAPTGEEGTAQGTLTFNPVRNAQGQITGGSVTFSLVYEFTTGAPLTFTGLHIHEGAAGVAAGVVINTGLSGSNTIVSPTGRGVINLVAPLNTPASQAAMTRLLANPAGFYVNIHTTRNPGGVIRSQLPATLAVPLTIASVNKFFLPTGTANATIGVVAAGNLADLLLGTVLLNGQPAQAVPDLSTGLITVTVPAALLANPGVLALQIRTPGGVATKPLLIPVAAQTSVNTQAVVTVEAAGFSSTSVAPESIAAAFGTRLASATASAPATPTPNLPIALDETRVYVNGVLAPLFYVSANQINYVIPEGTASGPAAVVVVARDGTVSQGTVLVTNIAPGIFTRTGNGLGAPSAVASTDGQNFNILISNPDGTPVAIDAGNFISLFGTGLRFVSLATATPPVAPNATAAAGGVTITPMFVGAQGQFVGLDQVNLQIPQSLAGRGELDLVLTVDGRASNPVKIRIK